MKRTKKKQVKIGMQRTKGRTDPEAYAAVMRRKVERAEHHWDELGLGEDFRAAQAKEFNNTKYDPERHPKLVHELRLLGLGYSECAKVFGVSKSVFENWLQTYPAFKYAYMMGGQLADGKVAASLFKRATGFYAQTEEVIYERGKPRKVTLTKYFPPDTAAAKYWLSTRTRGNELNWDGFRDNESVLNAPNNIQNIFVNLEDFQDNELETLMKLGVRIAERKSLELNPNVTDIEGEEVEQ